MGFVLTEEQEHARGERAKMYQNKLTSPLAASRTLSESLA